MTYKWNKYAIGMKVVVKDKDLSSFLEREIKRKEARRLKELNELLFANYAPK